MSKVNLLERIKSSFILESIFSFTKDSDVFLLKICFKNNNLRKKLKLSNLLYFCTFHLHHGLNIDNYIFHYFDGIYGFNEIDHYDKDILKKRFNTDFSRFGKINIHQYIHLYSKILAFEYYFDLKNFEKDVDYFRFKPIEIYSPLLYDLSKIKVFDKIFYFPISVKIINRFNLKDDYIKVFNYLNKINSRYSSLRFFYQNSEDLNYLKDFSIKFNQIKLLDIIPEKKVNINNYDIFFKNFFSFENIEKSLIELKIEVKSNYNNKINSKLFKYLNKFQLIENLDLNGFYFNDIFYLKLQNLKKLRLFKCINITLDENSCSKLKKLIIEYCNIVKIKTLLKFPELENIYSKGQILNDIIDFKSLKNLKSLTSEVVDFINLEKIFLTEVNLSSEFNYSKEIEDKMINKLITIDTLKIININLKYLDDDEIRKIDKENYSVKILTIHLGSDKNILKNLVKKFPNLSDLSIYPIYQISKNSKIKSKFEEFKFSDITKLVLKENAELYISYEKIKSIDIGSEINFNFLNFLDTNKKIFKSLIEFKYGNEYDNISLDNLTNIYKFIDKMPNLKIFIMYGGNNIISEEFYENFIKKILDLNYLKELIIDIRILIHGNEEQELSELPKYSENELKELYPNLNYQKFETISIGKLTERKLFDFKNSLKTLL